MSFNEFLQVHQWFEFGWEIFKGVAPTLVAVLAIVINNLKSSKRDKRNKKIDVIVTYENLLVEKISSLENLLDDLNFAFSEIFKCTEKEKLSDICNRFDLAKKELIGGSLEVYNLTICAESILKENVDGKEVFDTIASIIRTMCDVNSEYLEQTILQPEKNTKRDEKLNQINDDIKNVKVKLTMDMKRIMEKTFSLLE